ncbi:MAG TPA: glycogen-binding domain-containing protein [Gemmatimonadales bacterium]
MTRYPSRRSHSSCSSLLCLAVGLILRAIVAPLPASAQLAAAIEGSGARVRYEGGDGISVFVLRPMLEWYAPSLSVAADGGLAQFAGGGWTLQGSTAASGFTPLFSHLRGELALEGAGSTHQDGTTAGEVLGHSRVYWNGSQGGAWLGGALGQAWNGIEWQADRRAEAGVWIRQADVTITAAATPTWLAGDLKFVDAGLTASMVRDRLELSAFGGIRNWSQPAGVAGSTWGGGSAAFWFLPNLALVAAGGSYPTDYAQGLPAGSYISLGLRVASRRLRRDTPTPLEPRLPVTARVRPTGVEAGLASPTVSGFRVQPGAGRQQVFEVRAPTARRVELIGDFTQWQAVSLTRSQDGTWSVTLTLDPGLHRLNLRVDDAPWGVPPGVPAVADDFGGLVGVLEIARP